VNAPRILAIMGSGETGSAMAKVHRDLFGRLRAANPSATIVDTPYGFQENADDITARIVEYFQTSLGRAMTVASYRSRDADAVGAATALARIREADYVLAGPGSPSYVLRQWAGGPIPDALASKLMTGGVVTMASAAALTLGVVTIPVYEIYKVGADPFWLDGLDLLGVATGLRAAVVPHYDNAEGGNHDTRFCYVGERRLRTLEALLPDDAFVLGVDGHTALVLDLEDGTATVLGLGGVTVRVQGRSRAIPAGRVVSIEALADIARELRAHEAAGTGAGLEADGEDETSALPDGASAGSAFAPRTAQPGDAGALEGSFSAAMAGHDVRGALESLMDLDTALEARLRAGEDSPDLDGDRALYRSLIIRLGEAAEEGARDPREALSPLVETLLELRGRARDTRDWQVADLIRERLNDAGVGVHDADEGSTWTLEPKAGR
jgi:cyanophycinase-like exopeptidase